MASTETQLRIGRYALLGRVGRGGMGEVHRARAFAAAGVTKDLCIKRIRKSRLADPAALARFVDEARLWMRLSHANIVPVFDFGRIENDYYLAMEWVDGCDLRRLLDDAETGEPLEDDVALFVACELARALSYLHDAGAHEGRAVAHCDLKPSNVLLSRSSEVKLADFGVAVAAESARAGGTRGYIPPNEERGARVGTASDLYALGRVLEEIFAVSEVAAGGGEESEAALGLAARLVAADPSLTAARVADELETLSARARVRSNRSPRELLAARVARLPSVLEAADVAELHTDASFLNASPQSALDGSFLSQMEADLSQTTATQTTTTHPTPVPPLPTRAPRKVPVAALTGGFVLAMLAGIVASLDRPLPSSPDVAREEHAAVPAEPVTAEVAVETVEPEVIEETAEPEVIEETAEPEVTEETAEPEVSEEPALATVRVVPHAGVRTARAPEAPVGAHVEAAPEAPAHLRINARPWAEVTVDGTPRGITPITDLELPPGRHEVRLLHPVTGRESTTLVDLGAGEHRDVIVDLRR